MSQYGLDVLDLLGDVNGSSVLDLGCGDGILTKEIVNRGATVLGVDSSAEMVEAATKLGVDARVMDAANLSFESQFDNVFSNATLHWVRPPERVIEGVWDSLTAGGTFAGEFGGHGNVAAIVTAITAVLKVRGVNAEEKWSWYFPTVRAYNDLLEAQGFFVESIALLPRPTILTTDINGWLRTFANSFFTGFSPDEISEMIQDIVELLRPSLCDDQGIWTGDYIRLRFKAIKPA